MTLGMPFEGIAFGQLPDEALRHERPDDAAQMLGALSRFDRQGAACRPVVTEPAEG